MPYSFRAGVRLEERKSTAALNIENLPEPKRLIITADAAWVKPGEPVKKWQSIGEADGMPLHSPVSGTTESVGEGRIIIQNDFLSTPDEGAVPVQKTITELSAEEITQIIKNAGIYSAGEPAFELIQSGKKALVVNLLECEPFLCAAQRLAVEKTAEILNGAKILMKACGVRKAYIAVESGKRDAVKAFRDKIGLSKLFELRIFKPRYPQANPKLIAYALEGTEDCSQYAFFDGFCCTEVYRALSRGIPSTSSILTVDGDCIAVPKNLRVPIGTPLSHIIEYCGGLRGTPHKVIYGGPLSGRALYSPEDGLCTKAHGLIFLSNKFEKQKTTPCIRCGRCLKHCPMFLVPSMVAFDKAPGRESCISCGVCSYVCPANIPLTQLISCTRSNDKK